MIDIEKKCLICGRSFEARRDYDKCCSAECSRERHRRYQQKYNRDYYQRLRLKRSELQEEIEYFKSLGYGFGR